MKKILSRLLKATEHAAINVFKYIGSGRKEIADLAATDVIKSKLNKINSSLHIAVGEWEKDNSQGLKRGEMYGKKKHKKPKYCIAVDPIEGTTATANGGNDAISVIAATNGHLYSTDKFYMNKLVIGKTLRHKVHGLDISLPITEIVAHIMMSNPNITICMLNRPRHAHHIQKLREMGARIKLIQDCDLVAAINVCLENKGIDILYGIGGATETVLAACAAQCLDGFIQAQLVDEETWQPIGEQLSKNDLASGNCFLAASGITNGSLLPGVSKNGTDYTVSSLTLEVTRNYSCREIRYSTATF